MHPAPRTLICTLVVVTSMLVGTNADAAFSPEQLKCRETISKNGQKLADTAVKTLVACHKARSAGKLDAGTDCNDTVAADDKGKIGAAATKLSSQAVDACPGITPSEILYSACPSPCDAQVPTMGSFDDVGSCIICMIEQSSEALASATLGNPDPLALNKSEVKCHGSIGKAETKYLKILLKERRKCQKLDEAAGGMDTSACVAADPSGKIGKLHAKGEALIDKSCSVADVDLADLDSCSDFGLSNLKSCVFASADARGTTIFQSLYELSATGVTTTTGAQGTTTTTTVTTTTLPGGDQDPQCPDSAQLIIYAGVRETACTTNTDCEVGGVLVGECDTGLGLCVTATDLDTGYTGFAHNSDINDALVTRGRLSCPGPFRWSGWTPRSATCAAATTTTKRCVRTDSAWIPARAARAWAVRPTPTASVAASTRESAATWTSTVRSAARAARSA